MSSAAHDTLQHAADSLSGPLNGTERALLDRIVRYFVEAIDRLPKRDKVKALAARDDFWTVMETLALAPVAESPELRVRLRGALARRELLETEGGVMTPSSVAQLLHISRQAVGQRRAAGKLLGVETPTGYMYPVWQFDGTHTLAGLDEILQVLGDHEPWTQLIFFLAKNDASGGKRPLDLLRRGKLSPILRAARLHGVHAAV